MIINKFVLLGLLIGLLIILFIYLYTYEIILEKFNIDDDDDAVDPVDVVDSDDSDVPVDIDIYFRKDRYIYLTTDVRKNSDIGDYINKEQNRWYNFDYQKNSEQFFIFGLNIPDLLTINDTPIVYGLNMNNVTLRGPNASELSVNDLLIEFTLLLNFDISDKNFIDDTRFSLYEMPAASSITGNTLGGKAFSLQIAKIDDTTITLDILFGSQIFSEQIQSASLINNINFIALSYKDTTINLIVNGNDPIEFSLTNDEKLNLSNSPIMINKEGMDVIFYNIAIYKRQLLNQEISKLKTHFTNHVTGLLSQTRKLDSATIQNAALLQPTNKCEIVNSELIKITPIVL